ncbi:PTS mannose transporter subunit IIC [Candidatus Cryosericum hinesii]|jgi:mannose/fructose/N-acetylgalactosamine-specific phosphotransferase system component IID/mannose/fructose/N-acetylgalactosamine-specific phosphotransferase system component IIC|uniref:PTS mannose transporter subunit IIC n=2 Tax=Candidatus Cryosericum hinesii TaxID=2290915 RepID=A0A398DPL3_9BACT|nr:PTS system mannose/fructose/sorbose family transporter subunit IID [Candidatus Cryosericum hinesii]RIE12496.1 PTS mannose transporter subunit IIC [Candidatus Cryosericum hinesii]RIE12691.1 PTS mannose transporter subunit IIC [Candidatus Cryosericum hinesii]
MTASYGFGISLILAIWSYVAMIANLGPSWLLNDPIVSGFFVGAVVGNIPLGLAIGGTLELMSLGLWTYGGATTPDYTTGAIVGTAFAALSKLAPTEAMAAGMLVAVPVSLFMTQLDIVGRSLTTVFIHGADRAVEKQDDAAFSRWHLWGQLPWGLSRAIPVFFAVWLGSGPIQSLINNIPTWLTRGLGTMGHILPALGFGILLTFLPIEKWWSFFVLGFVMFAYLNVPLLGIALAALAVVIIYFSLKPVEAGEQQAEEAAAVKVDGIKSPVTRGDLVNAMWRHNLTLQLSWNYERMQALGYAWSIAPILKKVYPKKDEYFTALKRHMVFYNTNPAIGSPTIFGADCALEEKRQPEVGDSLKVSLMGPFAGIGDTVMAILMKPIFAVFAASLALQGHASGAWLMLFLGFFWFFLTFPGFWLGYRQGLGLVRQVSSGAITRITDMASTAALFIMGGFIPSILAGVKTPLEITKHVMIEGKDVVQSIKIQDSFDKILPYMLPLALVFCVYWLLKKKHWTNLQVLLLLVVAGIILGAFKIL